MATQTGSIDLKAAKKAHDDAEKVATNYVADISNGILVHPDNDNTNGVKITNVVEVIRSSASVAEFGTSARIGENASGKSRTEIGTGGMQIIQNVGGSDESIAHLGYGPGNNSGGGTSNAPYYTLGIRSGTVGNYSCIEGEYNEASGALSHAEGSGTVASEVMAHAEGSQSTASGEMSHAEGMETTASSTCAHVEGILSTASGQASHAEGGGTTASGLQSHAEGWASVAGGRASHAQNSHTKATSDYQTALGQYNVEDNADTYAVIIGNGTADNARSNALTVDWSGNVGAAGDVNIATGKHFKINGSNLSASDVGALSEDANGDLTVTRDITAGGDITDGNGNVLANKLDASVLDDYVVEQGTSGQWTYTKWNSGKLEQWYVGNPGSYTVGTTRGQLRSGGYISYAYPIAFVGDPSVTVNATLTTDSYVVWAQASDHSTSGIKVRIVASANIAANSNYAIHIHAVGKWK